MIRKYTSRTFACLLFFSFLYTASIAKNASSFTSVAVAKVPAAFPVNFALFTSDSLQFVAFYDTSHQLTLAKRNLKDTIWTFQTLASKVGWDSHNYLSMTLDRKGLIHLAGNMHSSPLIYFRSSKPYDIHSMQPVHFMTGEEEDIATYPEFMLGPEGSLIFHYRYGVSGDGYEVFNRWHPVQNKWYRLLDTPLTDGQNKMNAYIQGPLLGPDSYFHILWVWRDTPDCATNHTLSYARSKDLVHWESIRGEKLKLPITLEDEETWVDNTQVFGGLINIGIKIGFDASGKVLPSYHKYDENGNTQLYIARFLKNKWLFKQVSAWDYRWDFKGFGTIRNDLLIEAARPGRFENEIIFAYHHIKYGDGQIVIDNNSLQPIRTESFDAAYPGIIDTLESTIKGMQVNKVYDSGINPAGDFLLRWETLGPNRDQTPQKDQLPASLLQVIEY